MVVKAPAASKERIWGQIIARVWIDEEFKKRFMLDPRGVLAEHGTELDGGVEFKVVEDTSTMRHIILPPAPTGDLVEEDFIEKDLAWCASGPCGRCGCGCGPCRCG
jgi:hypothetical protein